MPSRGFEFGYMIDGSPAVPVVRKWPMAAAASARMGDLLVVNSSGYLQAAAGTCTEQTAILMEDCAGTIVAGVEKAVALITLNQVWRCSMNAASTNQKKGYTKTVDLVDERTLSTTSTSGNMILVDTGEDDAGNVLAYVQMSGATFGT